ncbi:hypothetical protein Tco_1518378, partial [Tanacetum coccineum]
EEAFARRQAEEFDAISLRAIVYKFDERSSVSKSTPSSFQIKHVDFRKATSRPLYVVPTGRVIATDSVIVATSGYVVPAAYDISLGRVK